MGLPACTRAEAPGHPICIWTSHRRPSLRDRAAQRPPGTASAYVGARAVGLAGRGLRASRETLLQGTRRSPAGAEGPIDHIDVATAAACRCRPPAARPPATPLGCRRPQPPCKEHLPTKITPHITGLRTDEDLAVFVERTRGSTVRAARAPAAWRWSAAGRLDDAARVLARALIDQYQSDGGACAHAPSPPLPTPHARRWSTLGPAGATTATPSSQRSSPSPSASRP